MEVTGERSERLGRLGLLPKLEGKVSEGKDTEVESTGIRMSRLILCMLLTSCVIMTCPR